MPLFGQHFFCRETEAKCLSIVNTNINLDKNCCRNSNRKKKFIFLYSRFSMITRMNSSEISTGKMTWEDHRKVIFEEQQNLFDNNTECDCVLISAQGKRISAHQVVLSTSSDFFRKILNDLPASVQLPTIHVPDADTCILEAILKFLYTGQTYIDLVNMNILLGFLNFLGVKCFSENELTLTIVDNGVAQTISSYGATDQPYNKSSSESLSEDEFLAAQADDLNYQEMEDDTESIEPDYLEEYLDDDSILDIKEEQILIENDSHDDSKSEEATSDFTALENATENNGVLPANSTLTTMRRRQGVRSSNVQIDKALNEVNNGKTIHRLSVEYNLPRSTLYHRFRNNENLKQNYRSERKSALDNAVRAVLNERLSLKMAADRYKLPKTGTTDTFACVFVFFFYFGKLLSSLPNNFYLNFKCMVCQLQDVWLNRIVCTSLHCF